MIKGRFANARGDLRTTRESTVLKAVCILIYFDANFKFGPIHSCGDPSLASFSSGFRVKPQVSTFRKQPFNQKTNQRKAPRHSPRRRGTLPPVRSARCPTSSGFLTFFKLFIIALCCPSTFGNILHESDHTFVFNSPTRDATHSETDP